MNLTRLGIVIDPSKAKSGVDEVNKAVKTIPGVARTSSKKVENSFEKMAGEAKTTSSSITKVNGSFKKIPPAAKNASKKVESSLKKMARAAEKSGGRIDSSFIKTAASAKFTTTAIVAIATGTLALKKALGTSREFGAAMSDLSAITGATGKDLEYLKNAAIEFGSSTTLSAVESAEAIKLIASAKPDLLENAKALSDVTAETILLAEASGTLLPDAARTLGTSLNQFGANADQAARFVNVLAAGSKFGAAEVAEAAAAIEKAGTVAKAAGVSFEELNAMIQLLAQRGIKGSEAGTQLKSTLLKLQTGGIAELNPKLVGLSQALENLAARNMDVTKMTKLFGLESFTVAKILSKSGVEVDALTAKLTDTNTAFEQATIRTDNLGVEIDELIAKLTAALEQATTRLNNLDGDILALNSSYETLKTAVEAAFDDEALIVLMMKHLLKH